MENPIMRRIRIKHSKLFILIIIFSFSFLLINIQTPSKYLDENEMDEDPIPDVITASDIHNKINTTICNANNNQTSPKIIGDGLGGAIIVWEDMRLSNKIDIYAQRINQTGHPLWNSNGILISNRTGNSTNPVVTSDGEGGAIIAWQDDEVGNWEIYCQRINSTGQSPWNADFNRTRITTNGYNDTKPIIVSDGSGGAFIAWQTNINFPINLGKKIYMAHITSTGSVDLTPRRVCGTSNDQQKPRMVSDGIDGVIITWEDYRSGSDNDIYAQRINSTGDMKWAINGTVISNASREQTNPEIAQDGNLGAIITWQDFSSGSDYDIYTQRVNNTGHVQWQNNGNLICGVSNQQINPKIISANSGGAIIVWEDWRDISITSTDIYSQKITSDGQILWDNNGIPICNENSTQDKINIAPDGLNGGFIAWEDNRTGVADIYAQHIGSTGVSHWEDNGTIICDANASQLSPQVAQNGTNGAVITWQDFRNGNYDIYSQIVYTIDNSPPPAPIISSITHPDSNFAYSSNDVEIEWTKPQDASDITNYFYMWDKNPNTIPEFFEHIIDTRNVSLNNLSDGTWYFHVRANDTAGNAGETGHFNFTIDTSCDIEFVNYTLEQSTHQHYTAVLEDFDQDGDLDFASTDNTSSLYIWWNPSNESAEIDPFEDTNNWTKTLIGTNDGDIKRLKAADLNYDGRIDLIGSFNEEAIGTVTIWKNNETPRIENWSAKGIYSNFGIIEDLDVGDYNRDGDIDVIFSTNTPQILTLSNPINFGTDPFSVSWISDPIGGGSQIPELKISDINIDGFPDVIYTDGQSISAIKRNSSGWTDLEEIFNVSANITAFEITDLDYNGKLDIIVGTDSGEILAYAHNGDPFSSDWNKTFMGKINESGSIVNTLSIGDLGKNGYDDIIAAFELESQKTVIQIYKNNRRPFFDDWATTEQGTYESICHEIALGDIDHNGVIDAVFSNKNVYLARNSYERLNIRPKFSDRIRIINMPWDEYMERMAFGDLDQDGDLDVVGAYDDTNAIIGWRNNGDPFGTWSKFTLKGSNSSFGNYMSVELGDLDDDGWLDIVAGYGIEGHILRNDHTPWNGTWENYKFVPSSWVSIKDLGVADFDHDGNLDIAGTSASKKCLYIWKNNGTAFRANWAQYKIGSSDPSEMRFMKITDFDKDSWPDIVSTDHEGHLYFWRNNHTPFISNWPDYVVQTIGGGQNQITVADMDFDGDPDISTYATYTSLTNTKVLECDDTPFNNSWNSYTIYNQYYASYGIDSGDVDSDGWEDIVVAPVTTIGGDTRLTIIPNNHSPFNNWWDYYIIYNDTDSSRSEDIKLLDIDRDGDLDILIASYSPYGIYCWKNLAEQDFTGPTAPIINSTTHPNQSSWYNSLTISLQWEAHDPSGINNYYYCFDQNSNTTPTLDNQSTSKTSINHKITSEGTWYFHIRANDTEGNLGETAHFKFNAIPGTYQKYYKNFTITENTGSDQTNVIIDPVKFTAENMFAYKQSLRLYGYPFLDENEIVSQVYNLTTYAWETFSSDTDWQNPDTNWVTTEPGWRWVEILPRYSGYRKVVEFRDTASDDRAYI
ncbi:MAG: hypothetical protein EU549_00220, partial [Promethearchaeota archaeon]